MWLADFGIARALEDQELTGTGVIAGTPRFSSPEQAEGKDLDFRSDLFSLGSLLYTMSTGTAPFEGDTIVALLKRIAEGSTAPAARGEGGAPSRTRRHHPASPGENVRKTGRAVPAKAWNSWKPSDRPRVRRTDWQSVTFRCARDSFRRNTIPSYNHPNLSKQSCRGRATTAATTRASIEEKIVSVSGGAHKEGIPLMPDSSASPAPTKRSVFFARLTSTLILWALVTAGIVLNLDWLFAALIGGLGFLALLECLKMFGVHEDRRYQVWTVLVSLAYLGSHFHPSVGHAQFARLDLFFLGLLLFGLFTVTLTRPLDGEQTLKRLLGCFFSFFYTIILFSFLSRLLQLPVEHGVLYVLYLVAVTKFTDMGAYAIGSLCGKHKMIPHISPGKTWEGFGGALLGAYVASAAIYFPFQTQLAAFNTTHILILPLVLGLTTVIGDLAESVLKRCLQVKDSGNMLPGIGGALDLIDSLCFTAPVLYLYMNYFIDLGS